MLQTSINSQSRKQLKLSQTLNYQCQESGRPTPDIQGECGRIPTKHIHCLSDMIQPILTLQDRGDETLNVGRHLKEKRQHSPAGRGEVLDSNSLPEPDVRREKASGSPLSLDTIPTFLFGTYPWSPVVTGWAGVPSCRWFQPGRTTRRRLEYEHIYCRKFDTIAAANIFVRNNLIVQLERRRSAVLIVICSGGEWEKKMLLYRTVTR